MYPMVVGRSKYAIRIVKARVVERPRLVWSWNKRGE